MDLFIKIITLTIVFFFICSPLNSQSITGYVVTKYEKEPLPGANIVLEGISKSAATNIEGKYTIENVPVGTYTLQVSMIGFYQETKEINITSANQQLECSFELSPGPSFANSTKYLDYHRAVEKAFSINPKLIELKVRKHQVRDNIEINLEIVNNWDQAIFLPKSNFHLLDTYICELIDFNDKPVRRNVVYCGNGAKVFYRPDDILIINALSNKKLEPIIITDYYLPEIVGKDSLKFRIKYNFDITKPLRTSFDFPTYPSANELAEMEDTYCKILRLPLVSKTQKVYSKPFYKFW